jgi:hypothetical protein
LHAEVDTQVFGLNWRPLVQLKIGARAGLQGLVDYVESITYLLFYLPTILIWLITILLGAAAGWRMLRWTAQHVFPSLRTSTPAKIAYSLPSPESVPPSKNRLQAAVCRPFSGQETSDVSHHSAFEVCQ